MGNINIIASFSPHRSFPFPIVAASSSFQVIITTVLVSQSPLPVATPDIPEMQGHCENDTL